MAYKMAREGNSRVGGSLSEMTSEKGQPCHDVAEGLSNRLEAGRGPCFG